MYRLIPLLIVIPALACATERTLEVEFLFDPAAVPAKTVASYRLYQNGELQCDIPEKSSGFIDCAVDVDFATYTYELAAHYTDGTDSPKSPPFLFTISDGGEVPVPAQLTAAVAGENQWQFGWNHSGEQPDFFVIYRNGRELCRSLDGLARSLTCGGPTAAGEVSLFAATAVRGPLQSGYAGPVAVGCVKAAPAVWSFTAANKKRFLRLTAGQVKPYSQTSGAGGRCTVKGGE